MAGYLQEKLWIRQVPSYYSPAQIRQYLSKTSFQPIPEEDEIRANKFHRSLEVLERLARHHILTFPFENTAMHYTASHTMDVSPQGAFDRLVLQSKGSYCFGQNGVLLGILRGLGFRAYSGAARVNANWTNPGAMEEYHSHSHMVIFVQPYDDSNRTWLVDVGFGMGPVRPIPLIGGDESTVKGVGPTEAHRLRKGPIPQSSLATALDSALPSGQDSWTMEVWKETKDDVANHPTGNWHCQYSFSEQEFYPPDYTDAAFVVAQSAESFFASRVICVKAFVDGQSGSAEDLYRVVLTGNEVKKHARGEVEIIQTFASESERLKALREMFGIDIGEDAIQHIEGRASALQ